jgi:hypothetical protein
MEDHATGLRFYQGNIYSKVFTNPRTEISSICLFNVSTAEVSQFSRGPWSSHPYTAGDPYYIAGHLSYLVSEKLTQVSENPCGPACLTSTFTQLAATGVGQVIPTQLTNSTS